MVIFLQKHQEFYGYFKEDNGNIVGFANNTTDTLKKHTQKIATSQEDDYIIICFLKYPYFRKHYKMIAIDLKVNNKHYLLIQKQYSKLIYWKYREECNNVFYYWKSKGKYFFSRNRDIFVNLFCFNLISV